MKIAGLLLFLQLLLVTRTKRSFTVDWDKNTFLKDGKPFRYISGSMHYFRIPKPFWRDRLYKMKLAGLDTIQTYIAWNFHEISPGQYKFDGDADLEGFLQLAKEMGMLVVLRPGPYICAEWTFGGLPYWLIKEPGIKFREYSDPYIKAIAAWFKVVLPKVKPYLYRNGGSIITVQVENEYGAYGPHVCDKNYLKFILEQYQKYLGKDVVYTTVDNRNVARLECGNLPKLLKTLDFGPDKIPHFQFEMLRKYQPQGPLVNAEFWAGWFDKWGDPSHANVSENLVAQRLNEMLQLNASVNFYVFEGGTNFGFTSGAMSKDGYAYNARVTSYDYNAALSEAGDTTDKYWAARAVIKKYKELPPDPVPAHSPKWESADIHFSGTISIFNNLGTYHSINTSLPFTMEYFDQSDGYILYELLWTSEPIQNISLYNVHDRAVVYLNTSRYGVIDRRFAANGTIVINSTADGPTSVKILVENMGRVNHGSFMGTDFKGITRDVLIDGKSVGDRRWTVYSLPFDKPPDLVNFNYIPSNFRQVGNFLPTIYCGKFSTPNQHDSFLDPTGWGKGVAYLNGINLGRYWPTEGPQVTLYTPGIHFKQENVLCVLETEQQEPQLSIKFIKKPILQKPHPKSHLSF